MLFFKKMFCKIDDVLLLSKNLQTKDSKYILCSNAENNCLLFACIFLGMCPKINYVSQCWLKI